MEGAVRLLEGVPLARLCEDQRGVLRHFVRELGPAVDAAGSREWSMLRESALVTVQHVLESSDPHRPSAEDLVNRRGAQIALALAEATRIPWPEKPEDPCNGLVRFLAVRSIANWGLIRWLDSTSGGRALDLLAELTLSPARRAWEPANERDQADWSVDWRYFGEASGGAPWGRDWGFDLLRSPETTKRLDPEARAHLLGLAVERAAGEIAEVLGDRGEPWQRLQRAWAIELCTKGHVSKFLRPDVLTKLARTWLVLARRAGTPAGTAPAQIGRDVLVERALEKIGKRHVFRQFNSDEQTEAIGLLLGLVEGPLRLGPQAPGYDLLHSWVPAAVTSLAKAHVWVRLSPGQKTAALEALSGYLLHRAPSNLDSSCHKGRSIAVLTVLQELRRPALLGAIPRSQKATILAVITEYAEGTRSPDPDDVRTGYEDESALKARRALKALSAIEGVPVA